MSRCSIVEIRTYENGYTEVIINTIRFKGKRAIDWCEVEEYAQKYKGKEIICDGDTIYIDGRFADEYCWSKDTKRLKGTLAKAKANAIQAICELVENASNKRIQENLDEKHVKDAKYGWERYTCRFVLPVFSEDGEIERYNHFRIEMLVRIASNGNKYLYDFVNIKKETSKPF